MTHMDAALPSSSNASGDAVQPAHFHLKDSRRTRSSKPESGTYAEDVVLASMSREWVRAIPRSWPGLDPFDLTTAETPNEAVWREVHEHFERCAEVFLVGPTLNLVTSPPMEEDSYRLDNPLRMAIGNRHRGPNRWLVADQSGLEFDFFPISAHRLISSGFYSFEERSAHWRVGLEKIDRLGLPTTIRLRAWDAVIFPSNLILYRVRGGNPFAAADGYFRGLHPSNEQSGS